MSTKFFNNTAGNTLFDKLRGIASQMATFDRFLAVVGFFRSSGYFKLRKELGHVSEIKILIGINIDDIFRKHNKALLMLADEEKAKQIYNGQFQEDILHAHYAPEVEEGILQLCEDLVSGRLQMRIHATKNLHAKFYLCLPQHHTEHSDGWVIMGSSNISDSGLGIQQPPQYELNVAMKDYDDVKYCSDEFRTLWEEAVPLTADDVTADRKQTYLGEPPTPYELYIKVLIDTFGEMVEDDFTLQLPPGVTDLKYQRDAVIQGYQMLMRHNGFLLADVVGLGKTVIATMIAKRFIEANGSSTRLLVVYPPAVESNWRDTFTLFGIQKRTQFVTNGSLSKILEGRDQYFDKEEFDLVIVDEAHNFRSDDSNRYNELQIICKSPCAHPGWLKSTRKKVMLLSATPLNNRPEDILNLLLLFQNSQSCTIDGVPNLKSFFAPHIQAYKNLMREPEKPDERGRRERQEESDVTREVDMLYEQIRTQVIDKVTVRRTRNNILNDPDYKADLQRQGIVFPRILPPNELEYEMGRETAVRFYATLKQLTDGKSEKNPTGQGLDFARYRGVEFLRPAYRKKYKNAEHIGQTLSGIYRVHMVKRLESSFHAFKKSLRTLLQMTDDMIRMFDADKVIIAPDLKVKELQVKGMELDQIIEYAVSKGYLAEEIVYPADAFEPPFLPMLRHDRKILEKLNWEWQKEHDDPKYRLFLFRLSEFFEPSTNPSGKLVIFSESVDTLEYLFQRLTEEERRDDVLLVTSTNRRQQETLIKENFDAKYPVQDTRYNIILTSDVLAEGVNLHRSNVIINYDSPWNATRLIQRIGRVNRIGSVAPYIYNYLFYPSRQGDDEIQLYKNALIKLQGFHSAFGEDAKIYSREEIVHEFQLFDSHVKDSIDKKIALLREVRDLYHCNRQLYHKIKSLPMKSRVIRSTGRHCGESIVFVSSTVKTEFYHVKGEKAEAIDFMEAMDYLKAQPEEQGVPLAAGSPHYRHVNCALQQYTSEYVEATNHNTAQSKELDKSEKEARNFLRNIRQFTTDPVLKADCSVLLDYIHEGIYNQLASRIKALARQYKSDKAKMKQDEYRLQAFISQLLQEYQPQSKEQRHESQDISDPRIIISETFQ